MNPNDMPGWNMGGGQQPYPVYGSGGPGYPQGGLTGFPQQGYPGQPQMGGPGYGQPMPGYGQSMPGYGQPTPDYGQPTPSYGQPMPGYGQPTPGYGPGYGPPGAPGGQSGMAPGQCPPGPIGTAQPSKPKQPMGRPTLKPYPHFRPDEDCERLRKAMKGIGTDERTIIDILSHRSADQRAQLVVKFKSMYGKDLIKELKSELRGHFEDVVEAMCYPLDELDARELRRAMEGAGTDEDTLIEILASRSNSQIKRIKELYSQIFKGRNLEKDLKSETHGHFERILVSLSQGRREENRPVDMAEVEADAQALYNAGEKRLGTDESTFNRILVSKSEDHVRAVIQVYSKYGKKDFEEALKSEMSGDLLRAFLAVTRCIRSRPKFFALQLKKSMEGAGTRDRHLIRLVVTRAEIDMEDIKVEFMKANGKSLESWIADDTSGDYKRMLLALVT